MQNQYFGDVGDFAKYGLLRTLEAAGLSVGVHWYLVPDGVGNVNDGEKIGYLKRPERYRAIDAGLFDALREALHAGERSVRVIERSALLSARYYSAPLDFYGSRSRDRLRRREAWHAAALEELVGADVVFLDPDNGLEAKTARPSRKNGCKFAFYSEVQDYWARGQSLVVYHHLGRSGGTHQEQIRARLATLEQVLPGSSPIGLVSSRGTPRVFFVLPAAAHAPRLDAAVRSLLASPWTAGDKRWRVFEPEAHATR